MERKIYVASSWRNPFQPAVVQGLKDIGHRVYDFRNPGDHVEGFDWKQIDPDYEAWSLAEYKLALTTGQAQSGFESDREALDWADTCVLVLPCGASSHTEAGYMAGQGKEVYVLGDYNKPMSEQGAPELMYLLFTNILGSMSELLAPED